MPAAQRADEFLELAAMTAVRRGPLRAGAWSATVLLAVPGFRNDFRFDLHAKRHHHFEDGLHSVVAHCKLDVSFVRTLALPHAPTSPATASPR